MTDLNALAMRLADVRVRAIPRHGELDMRIGLLAFSDSQRAEEISTMRAALLSLTADDLETLAASRRGQSSSDQKAA